MLTAPQLQVPPAPDDFQQSWVLAETFKYLYLLFAEEGALSLEEFVLTTEAHPLRVAAPAPPAGVGGTAPGWLAGWARAWLGLRFADWSRQA